MWADVGRCGQMYLGGKVEEVLDAGAEGAHKIGGAGGLDAQDDAVHLRDHEQPGAVRSSEEQSGVIKSKEGDIGMQG